MLDRPWLRILLFALAGTTLTVALVVDDLVEYDHVAALLYVGEDGPAADVVREDIPAYDLAPSPVRGHDGQQFYAIARAPMHLDETAEHLDRPRYRLQRPLFPLLAWALQPFGGGTGLVVALAVVGVAGVLLSGVAAGALSKSLRGGTWPAFLVPVLPGAYAALRLTLADTLALGFLLTALYAAETKKQPLAVASAVAAVLTKESMLVLLVAHAVARRTKASVAAAVSATVTTVTWWLALRVLVDSDVPQVKEFTWPFGGMWVYADEWMDGRNNLAAVMAIGSFTLAFVALWRRGPRHPLFGPLAAMTAFGSVLSASVIALDFNGTRTLGPLLVLAILTLGTPTPERVDNDGARPPATAADTRDSEPAPLPST